MISEGEFLRVRDTRILFQDWMGPTFIQIVEEATGRTVRPTGDGKFRDRRRME
ncbi:MAG: hypothetical protein ACRDPX_11005 [Gaiellaceae bacterium]